jgi:4-amino-4-deoxy-L-arabinose transferase-like glycosyltransferase
MRRLASWASRPEVQSVVLLSVILAAAAALRLDGIGTRTLNHPEVYSPGIDLPWHLSNPNPRLTLAQTLKGSIGGEPHPPGYYILMLGWTKVFGSSILALRLPSVLFGVGSVLLVYLLGCLIADTKAALLASAMLAVNGFHMFYSQIARMYSMACFLGLLSTWLLVLLARRPDRPLIYCVLYVAATISALASHVYVWPLFITQLLWVLVIGIRTRESLVGLARVQVLTFILATPLIAIAAYQSSAATRPATLSPVSGVLRYLGGGALFEIEAWDLSGRSLTWWAAILALSGSLLLLGAAAKAWGPPTEYPPSVRELDGCGRIPRGAMVVAALAMTSSILLFAFAAKTMLPMRSTTTILAASTLPGLLALVDALVLNRQEWLASMNQLLSKVVPLNLTARSLILVLAVVPVTLVAVVSVLSPMLIQRGTLIFAPYLLIVLAVGLCDLLRRDRRWAALALMLAAVYGVSVFHYKSRPPSYDYKGLAAQWAPEIEGTDLIFVHGRGHPYDWVVAPIFYYLNARRYRYVGRDFLQAVRNNPKSRVWVMSLAKVPTEPEAINALTGHELRKRINAADISAELYVPKVPAAPARAAWGRGSPAVSRYEPSQPASERTNR